MEKRKQNFFSARYFIHDFVRIAAFLPGFLWWRPKHLYENENARKKIKGGTLLISNHVWFTDPIFLMYGIWYRRLRFVALKVLFNTPAKNFWFRHFLCIPIDRENVSMETFREIVGLLKDDEVVAMFPEGKINGGNDGLQAFRSGMILMAMQSRKPIRPVYIRKKKGVRYRLLIVVGEEMKLPEGGMDLNEISRATDELFEREKKLQEIAERYYGPSAD